MTRKGGTPTGSSQGSRGYQRVRGPTQTVGGVPLPPERVLSDEFGMAKHEPADDSVLVGSGYGLRTRIAPARLTNLESAIDIGDYWRLKCLGLMEENIMLKKQILDAVAETLRLRVTVREDDLA